MKESSVVSGLSGEECLAVICLEREKFNCRSYDDGEWLLRLLQDHLECYWPRFCGQFLLVYLANGIVPS
jgi:hypothetical protein